MSERVGAIFAARVKPEYGPSLPRLLAPRWQAASRSARAAAVAGAVALVAILLGAGLTLENASFSHGGAVPFSFEYRDLYRVAPEPGGYVRAQSRYPDGTLEYSYAVDPLSLPAYSGAVNGELPVYATGLVHSLARRYRGFSLRGEGRAKVNATLIGYQIAFFAEVEGRLVWGRELLFALPGAHPRAGVTVVMLSAPHATTAVLSPLEVGESGVLLRPLKSLTLG